ncbi:MAG: hypothetical protein JWN71_2329 [Xanthobacteraceae bacterium]|nr:hypothetical protein [Xanthobacteraceae bacterium]
MTRVRRVGAALAATFLLLVPAAWNGFPLLQYDTGGYLARWFEGYLVPSRSTVYGLFLAAGWPFEFWPVVALQALAAVWIVGLTLQVYGLGRPAVLVAVMAALSALTTLPWIASILLTDIFAGLSVLALHLLVLQPDCLSRWQRLALIVFIAFCVATHSATFAVLMALLALAGIIALLRRDVVPRIGVVQGIMSLALGAVMLLGGNYALAKRIAWTPGGYSILFARMLQDGIVQRYLAEHCPDRRLRLCDHQAELPRNADAFLWGKSAFDRLGRFDGLGDEMRLIALEALVEYPRLQIETAAQATLDQLLSVRSGEGVIAHLAHTKGIIERFTPELAPAMRAARQQQGTFGPTQFDLLNRIHVPVALGSMALLPLLAWLAWRRRIPADIGALATTVSIALLTNAFVCGALSNPHDRYGARLVWVATFVLTIAALRQTAERRLPAGVPAPAEA